MPCVEVQLSPLPAFVLAVFVQMVPGRSSG